MSVLNPDGNGGFGHPGYPEWEHDGGGYPPRCEACGYQHEPTDVCPIEEPLSDDPDDEPPLEEPAWVEAGLPEDPHWGYQPLPGPPPLPSEADLPVIVPEEPIVYEKPSYRYSSVMYRSDN